MPTRKLIDAAALKARLHKCVIILPNGEKCMADRVIDTQGAIDAEIVRHGQWIDSVVPDLHVAKCSLCGFYQHINSATKEERQIVLSGLYRYCAHCGARMDGSADNG